MASYVSRLGPPKPDPTVESSQVATLVLAIDQKATVDISSGYARDAAREVGIRRKGRGVVLALHIQHRVDCGVPGGTLDYEDWISSII